MGASRRRWARARSRRRSRHWRTPKSTPSRCAICTPGATTGTNARPPRRCARPCRRPTSRCPPRCCRRSRSTSGSAPRWSMPTSGRRWSAISAASRARLNEAGYRGPILIIQSHGGLATIDDAVRLAAGGVLSGPAGGVAGSRHAARLIGHPDLILFDMGGTSTDISLVVDGAAMIASDRRLAGQRVALPALDIVSIGAGGGSIARVDVGRRAARRTRERRRGARAGLLRPGRHGRHRDRRQSGARPARPRRLSRRARPARSAGRRSGRSTGSPRPSASSGWPRPRAFIA